MDLSTMIVNKSKVSDNRTVVYDYLLPTTAAPDSIVQEYLSPLSTTTS